MMMSRRKPAQPIGFRLAHRKALKRPSRERELELVQRWRAGDSDAGSILIEAHLPHVVSVAMRYRWSRVPLDDLVAEGCLGLLHGIEKFDETRGLRLLTYATHWIHATIREAAARSISMVSSHARQRLHYLGVLKAKRTRLEMKTGDGDRADSEVAESAGVSRERFRQLMARFEARDASLDAPTGPSGATTLMDLVAYNQAVQHDDLERVQMHEQVRSVLARVALTDSERIVLERRLLAEEGTESSLAEIGRELGVSREWARRLELRVKDKLREELRSVLAA